MDSKRGKTLVGAIVAMTVSTFAVPFGSIAGASTGSQITRADAGAMQIAEEEHHEVEEKTEQKTKEVQSGTTVVPAPVVVAPVVPVAPGAVEEKHEESKTTETEHAENGIAGSEEHHEKEMSHEAKSVPGAMESEHEEHETKEKVEHDR
jgi:hypothetical protein